MSRKAWGAGALLVLLIGLAATLAQAQNPGPKFEPRGALERDATDEAVWDKFNPQIPGGAWDRASGFQNPFEGVFGLFQPVQTEWTVSTAPAPELGEYWLGVAVSPLSPALRAQLGLAEKDGGLVVEKLMPHSPASKAGLKQFDVLSEAGGTPLLGLHDLMGQLEKSKGGPIPFELIRGGKRQTVTVTPAKRPGEGLPRFKIMEEGPEAEGKPGKPPKGLEELFHQYGGFGPWQFHFLHPGQILPPGAALHGAAKDVHVTIKTAATLPDGYKVEIVREDHKPAKITLTRGEEKWEVTEAELGKLPEKIRPEVERLARRDVVWLDILATPDAGFAGGFGAVGPGMAPDVRSLLPEPRLENRLNEMNRQIEELRKQIERLRAPAAKPPAEKPEQNVPGGRRI
jgi:hypothetical protein